MSAHLPGAGFGRQLTNRYVVSLTAIAVLATTGQVIIQRRLQQQLSDAHVINLAGRQRMLSQRLAKAARAEDITEARAEINSSLESLERVQRALRRGDPSLDLPGFPSPKVDAAFDQLQPNFEGLRHAGRALLTANNAAETEAARKQIDAYEGPFVEAMDGIVFLLDSEARARVAQSVRVELILFALTLLVLLLEALLVFRPVVIRLSAAVDGLVRTRNALARTESEQQATLQAIPDGLARLTSDGQLYILKSPGSGLFGKHVPTGASIENSALPDVIRSALAACQELVRHGHRLGTRELMVTRDDQQHAYELRVAASRGAGHVVMMRDVSAQRRLEAEVLDIRERTQNRVARELHDGLCQHLAGLALMARVQSKAPETDEVVQLLDEAVAEARELALGLYPATLANLGLVGALEELARHVEKVSDLVCEVALPDQAITIPDDDALQLYRIAQEASANAAKHAEADRLHIELTVDQQRLRLMVKDDGAGIPDKTDQGSGLGLDTMAYRTRLLNGELSIVTQPSKGTAVICTVPISQRSAAR